GFSIMGDVLLSHKATIGRTALVEDIPTEYIMLTPQVTYYRVKDRNIINPRYLKSYFDGREFQETFSSWAGAGSTRAYLGITGQRKLPIRLPPIDVQNDIADVVASIDNKIVLSQLMNETLEAMARGLFKSWFVDFDPVRAKAEGRIPEGMDAQTAKLFPSSFNDNGIPEGWDICRLADILKLAYGKALKKTDRIDGDISVYGSGGFTGYHNKHLVTGPGIIVGRKGTVGTLYWEQDNFYPIDTVFYVIPHNGYSLEYVYYLLQTLGLQDMNTDAAVPGLNRNNVYRLEIANVPISLVNAYTEVVRNLRNKISLNLNEIKSLQTIRDTLLPKLISGQIRIGEEEDKIKEKA
ncbi:restriction endonuclease subunit S, partial [Candidatus Pacearchaeota archaeon]|nr:restriction endonuclease subunit S [Candidatus Pacearchaeota archaeon]